MSLTAALSVAPLQHACSSVMWASPHILTSATRPWLSNRQDQGSACRRPSIEALRFQLATLLSQCSNPQSCNKRHYALLSNATNADVLQADAECCTGWHWQVPVPKGFREETLATNCIMTTMLRRVACMMAEIECCRLDDKLSPIPDHGGASHRW